jgi:hypothetical protein
MRIEVVASGAHRFTRRFEPVRVGIPVPRGSMRDSLALQLFDPAGDEREVTGRAIDRWSDGSVRWLLIDFQADHDGGDDPGHYELSWTGSPAAFSSRLSCRHESDRVIVDTGAAEFHLRAGGRCPFEQVLVDHAPALDVAASGLTVEDEQRRPCTVVVSEIQIEESNVLRAVVQASGRAFRQTGEGLVELFVRMQFTAGSPTVRFDLTLRNERAAAHPGGFWELGDPGSVHFHDVTVFFALPDQAAGAAVGKTEVRCSPETGAPLVTCGETLELYQDSSGGERWRSRNHANRTGTIPLSFRGYRLRTVSGVTEGLRATPIVTMRLGPRHLSATMPLFWENFPKAIETTGRAIALRLFPGQFADAHELQGGEQKTHTFFVAFAGDSTSEVPLAWAREPLLAHATPSYYSESGAISYLAPRSDDPHTAYDALVQAAIEGGDSFERKRERLDEYGWRHFGDVYADHEAVQHSAPDDPLVSHYNNQYDGIAGCAYQFMRSADIRWWRLFTALAVHVRDIDLYHTDQDKAAYNHGLFWHTSHYVDAGLATHRSYPRSDGVWGGGPSNEHNYADGLLLHHFLTGEAASREAVLELAAWVIAMDDGTRTVFRWLARSATGLASATQSPSYHGPGRGAGNSIKVLLAAHQLTRDAIWLDKAEALIRRCIHPLDDIPRRELLDAERRWSYTIFLHAVARYLDYKTELGELDAMFAYGRASLVAYVRWMADHESPYLDHPERLEYPTETWAAQELWKSEVFLYGARHSLGDERARFVERSSFFFEYAVRTLSSMNTRTLARPMTLLLSRGHMAAYFARHPGALASSVPVISKVFERPTAFVSQKQRAKQRLVILLAAVFAAAVLAAIAYFIGAG